MNAYVQRLAAAVQASKPEAVLDLVPALGGLALHFDPSFEGNVLEASAALVDACIKAGVPRETADTGETIEVPVCYAREFAPDLAEICKLTKLSEEEVIERHAAATYRVLMIGFAPGHAYLGGLDARLAVPRRAAPRAEVPAGSVAVANEQTVVYPYAISGGWNVIGRTPLVVFDAFRSRPSLFLAGDRVRFRPITREEFEAMSQ